MNNLKITYIVEKLTKSLVLIGTNQSFTTIELKYDVYKLFVVSSNRERNSSYIQNKDLNNWRDLRDETSDWL